MDKLVRLIKIFKPPIKLVKYFLKMSYLLLGSYILKLNIIFLINISSDFGELYNK